MRYAPKRSIWIAILRRSEAVSTISPGVAYDAIIVFYAFERCFARRRQNAFAIFAKADQTANVNANQKKSAAYARSASENIAAQAARIAGGNSAACLPYLRLPQADRKKAGSEGALHRLPQAGACKSRSPYKTRSSAAGSRAQALRPGV